MPHKDFDSSTLDTYSLSKLKLLYVDDEHEVLDSVKDLLEDQVESFFTATNGVEALEVINIHDVDIVLSDIYMPEMDGIKLSEIVKEEYPESKVILLSAFFNPSAMRKAIKIGVDDFIFKPFTSSINVLQPLYDAARDISYSRA